MPVSSMGACFLYGCLFPLWVPVPPTGACFLLLALGPVQLDPVAALAFAQSAAYSHGVCSLPLVPANPSKGKIDECGDEFRLVDYDVNKKMQITVMELTIKFLVQDNGSYKSGSGL